MALINRSKSFSMVFLAIVTLLFLSGEAEGRGLRVRRPRGRGAGGDICRRADYPGLCRAVVRGQRSPYAASQATVKQLIAETIAAKKAAAKAAGKYRQVLGVCKENYGDALSSLRTSLGNMKAHDKGSFNSNLSAALTDYETCEDTFSEMGIRSPLARTNTRLRQMADNGLYLATMWR